MGYCNQWLAPASEKMPLSKSRVQAELGPLLSSISVVTGPEDSRWANVTKRYQAYNPPKIQIVVRPGEERVIAVTVGAFERTLMNLVC